MGTARWHHTCPRQARGTAGGRRPAQGPGSVPSLAPRSTPAAHPCPPPPPLPFTPVSGAGQAPCSPQPPMRVGPWQGCAAPGWARSTRPPRWVLAVLAPNSLITDGAGKGSAASCRRQGGNLPGASSKAPSTAQGAGASAAAPARVPLPGLTARGTRWPSGPRPVGLQEGSGQRRQHGTRPGGLPGAGEGWEAAGIPPAAHGSRAPRCAPRHGGTGGGPGAPRACSRAGQGAGCWRWAQSDGSSWAGSSILIDVPKKVARREQEWP